MRRVGDFSSSAAVFCRSEVGAFFLVGGVAAALLLGTGEAAFAEEIFLRNGDRISGEVIEATEASITLQTEGLGVVTIDRAFLQEPEEPEEHAIPDPPTAPSDPIASTNPAASATHPISSVESPAIKIPKAWTGSISAGINAREGNTSNQSASARFGVSRKKDADELSLTGDFYFAASEKRMTAMKMMGGTRYDHYFEKNNHGWYGLGRFEADQDRFADINQRLVPAAGPGYAFYNLEDFKLKIEMAGGFAQTNFRDNTANRFEGILLPRLLFESRIYGQTRFIQDVNVYYSLSESEGYRVRSESTVEAPFLDRIKVRLSLIDDYNSNPSIGSERNDIRIISSVAYYL